MIDPLGREEARVVACLVEKEKTTPDYYPLTLAALTAACNQKNNRDPVMQVAESVVAGVLNGLKTKQWVWEAAVAGSRVPKYRHRFPDRVPVDERQLAVLCELMLRGPQTPGELRTHASRITPLGSVDEVLAILNSLEQAPDGPYVCQLPRVTGQREQRFAHLLCGPVDLAAAASPTPIPSTIQAPPALDSSTPRLEALETQVAQLQQAHDSLKAEFEAFRKQLE